MDKAPRGLERGSWSRRPRRASARRCRPRRRPSRMAGGSSDLSALRRARGPAARGHAVRARALRHGAAGPLGVGLGALVARGRGRARRIRRARYRTRPRGVPHGAGDRGLRRPPRPSGRSRRRSRARLRDALRSRASCEICGRSRSRRDQRGRVAARERRCGRMSPPGPGGVHGRGPGAHRGPGRGVRDGQATQRARAGTRFPHASRSHAPTGRRRTRSYARAALPLSFEGGCRPSSHRGAGAGQGPAPRASGRRARGRRLARDRRPDEPRRADCRVHHHVAHVRRDGGRGEPLAGAECGAQKLRPHRRAPRRGRDGKATRGDEPIRS